MLVVYAFMEQSQAAVVADEMGVIQAIVKGWELLRSNFWRLMLVSLIVYVGVGIVSGILIIPFMIPFFSVPFLIESSFFDTGPRSFGLIMAGFMLLLLPVMTFVQGITITFMKSAYVLVYLRLTRPRDDNAPIALETNA